MIATHSRDFHLPGTEPLRVLIVVHSTRIAS